MARGVKRLLLSLPTGGGKTTIISAIARSAVSKGGRVLVWAHRRELIDQIAERIGPGCGIILAADNRTDPAAPIQIASIQTLIARVDGLALEPTIIIIDEAHHATAKTYMDLIALWPNAFLIGFTATPYRAGGKGLGTIFQEIVTVATIKELMEEGHLVPLYTYEGKAPSMEGVATVNGDYAPGAMAEAVIAAGLAGDVVLEFQKIAAGRKAIVFAAGVEHSMTLADRFNEAGIKAEHLDGKTKLAERRRILADFKSGAVQVVVNAAVLTEGFDEPTVSAVVLARPTKSRSLWRQMVGRGLRPAPGKTDCLLLDHAGATAAHGYITDPDIVTLAQGVKRKTRPAEFFCPFCGEQLSGWPRECPECHKLLPRTPTDPPEEDRTKHLVLSEPEDSRASFYAQMCNLAWSKGYSPGWAFHKFLLKFGEGPARKDKRMVKGMIAWNDMIKKYEWTTPPPVQAGGKPLRGEGVSGW